MVAGSERRPNEHRAESGNGHPARVHQLSMQSHSNWDLTGAVLFAHAARCCSPHCSAQLSASAFVSCSHCDNVFSLENGSFVQLLFLHLLVFMMLSAHLNMFPCLRVHQFAKLINNLFVAVKCVMSNCKHCLLPSKEPFPLSLSPSQTNLKESIDMPLILPHSSCRTAPAAVYCFCCGFLTLNRFDKGYCR